MRKLLLSALTAGIMAAGGLVGSPAYATVLNDSGNGGCLSNSGWPHGGFGHISIHDDFTKSNYHTLHINNTSATGNALDCYNAYNVSGGSYQLWNTWQATGAHIDSCSFTGCTISNGTLAKGTYSRSGTNSGSNITYTAGGWNVYTSTSGYITKYYHAAYYRISVASGTSEGDSTNAWYF